MLDYLGVQHAAIAGHSYGAWLALRYALHAPARVSHLALLDPATCFAPLSLAYRLRSIPLVARPSAGRARRLLAWETGGRPLDPDWLAVAAAGADLGRPQIVLPRVPTPAELASLAMPALVVVAARSRSHDPAQVAAGARQRLPEVTVETLAQATHHTIPTEDADELSAYLAGFASVSPMSFGRGATRTGSWRFPDRAVVGRLLADDLVRRCYRGSLARSRPLSAPGVTLASWLPPHFSRSPRTPRTHR